MEDRVFDRDKFMNSVAEDLGLKFVPFEDLNFEMPPKSRLMKYHWSSTYLDYCSENFMESIEADCRSSIVEELREELDSLENKGYKYITCLAQVDIDNFSKTGRQFIAVWE